MTHHKSALKDWKFWVGVAVSFIALFYFLKDFKDPAKRATLWLAFREAKYVWLIPSILVMYLSIYLRGMRWQLFFRGIGHVPYSRLFGIQMIGFMGNSIFPLRAGEFMRAYLLGRKEKIGLTSSIATIAIERFFDLIGISVCFATVAGIISRVGAVITDQMAAREAAGLEPIKSLASLSAVFTLLPGAARMVWFFVGGVIVVALSTLYAPGICETCVRTAAKITGKAFTLATGILPDRFADRLRLPNLEEDILKAYRSFVRGLECIKDPKAVLLGAVFTALIWSSICYSEYLVIKAFDLDTAGVGYLEALFIMTALALAVAVPQAPGYLGTFHIVAGGATSLLIAKATASGPVTEVDERAAAFAIMLWFVQMIPIILAGFVCLKIMGLSLTEIKHDAEETEEELDEQKHPG